MDSFTEPVLVARDLERRFGHVVALRAVSLTVAGGDCVLLAGPNGAGKSTLLRTIAGLSRPARGTITIGGRDLRRDVSARGAVGFLSHHSFLYEDLTARENLRFAAALHGLADADARVSTALERAGLAPRAEARASILSHGTRQRLAIARATLNDPALLLLDEPFSGLDAPSMERLHGFLLEERERGRAIVCVTHQPADLWPVATRVVLLQHGRVLHDGPRPATLDEFRGLTDQVLAA